MSLPSGELLVRFTALVLAPVFPIDSDGGAGHDNNFPFCILMALGDRLLKMGDRGDSKGRNGPVEREVSGALIEMVVSRVVIKRQIS